jgi:hypothetical protein
MEHLEIKLEPNESEDISFIEQKKSNDPAHLPEPFLTSNQLKEIKDEPVIVLVRETGMEHREIKLEPNGPEEISFIQQKNSNDPTHLPEPFLTSNQLNEIKDDPVLMLAKETRMENNPNIQFLSTEQLALKSEQNQIKVNLLNEFGTNIIKKAKASKASISRRVDFRIGTPVKDVFKMVENGINKLTHKHSKL